MRPGLFRNKVRARRLLSKERSSRSVRILGNWSINQKHVMASLTTIANGAGTDKGTQAGAAHGYSLIYEMFLSPMRSLSRVDILEMGLAIGGPELDGDVDREVATTPSIETWLSYFESPFVVGFDISDFSALSHPRFSFVRGDSGSREDVERILALDRSFDVIIDDASHASYHQQLGLAVLFDRLKPGGLYMIEDMSWQPANFERVLPAVPLTSEVLANFVATGKCPETAAIDVGAARTLSRTVAAVCFFEESLLNALGDSYNARFGLPAVQRPGWRGMRSGISRSLSPYFWKYASRRVAEGLAGTEFVNARSVKLAVLQKVSD